MSTIDLYATIDSLPKHLRQEVANFITSLRKRHKPEVKKQAQRPFGLLKGKIRMSEDFDDPLEDFREYME